VDSGQPKGEDAGIGWRAEGLSNRLKELNLIGDAIAFEKSSEIGH
jgi:hypothetical protein